MISQTVEEVESYYRKEIKMGRPTRGLIQFIYHRACLLPKKKPPNKWNTLKGKIIKNGKIYLKILKK